MIERDLEKIEDNLLCSIKYNIFMDYEQLSNCQYKYIMYPDKDNVNIDTWRIRYNKMDIVESMDDFMLRAIDQFPIFIDKQYKVYYNVLYKSTHKFSYGVPYYLRKVSILSNKKNDKNDSGKLKEKAFVSLRTPTTQITMPMYKYKKLNTQIYDPYYPTIFNKCALGDINPNEYFEELKRWFIVVRRCYDRSYCHYRYFGEIGMTMPDAMYYNINGKINNFGSMRIFKNYIKLTKYCRENGVIPIYGYIEPNDYNMYCHMRYSFNNEDKLMISRFPTEVQTDISFSQNAKQLGMPFNDRINYTPSKAGRPKGSVNKTHRMITIKQESRDPWDIWKDKY